MYPNRVWAFLFALIGASALYFGIKASYHLYLYQTETASTTALTTTWTLDEPSNAHYVPQGSYTYVVDGITYSATSDLPRQIYRNRWAAEEDIASYDQKQWSVWYDPAHPSRSTLQKFFPIKECLSTALVLAILGYLIWLKTYVNRTRF